ncbi:large ribosomal subunit protein bL35 [Candidatus Absconditicoccus praedator]|uniref:large ribosomal subunit protein bL35 n=1 Tax=Candidatus Absconditicoccus praedator TaxID=2735562 RepID=UPI001E6104DF|nr:50S ribosomal protein L35 [Candidatus Absconditicoccus praedator]UFX82861.1 50S ribosomal protein L35 [Candidatus Absconditicoccus praedator]
MKLKSNSSMKKRIKVTGRGKLLHKKAGRSHLLTNKGAAPRKDLYGRRLSEKESTKIRNLIPYKAG